MKKILCIILTTAELCSPVMAGGKGRSYDDREDAYTPPQQRNSRSSRNQNQNQLQYTPSFNFYASQGPTQGKLSFGGTAAQVAARVMGGIAARNGDRNMMDIADGLGGIGEIASRTNDTRDPWGRFPGNPDYGKKPRNQNMNPKQQSPGQKRPYQQNNKAQPPVVNPVPPVIPKPVPPVKDAMNILPPQNGQQVADKKEKIQKTDTDQRSI